MASINMRGLQKEVARQYSLKFKRQVEKQLMAEIEKSKKEMMREFNDHSVTKDIEAGPSASNVPGGGSLFALIGFNAGDNPVDRLRAFLLSSVSARITKVSRSEISFSLFVSVPSRQEMDIISPLPWAAGRSWIDEVERGVSGLGKFLTTNSQASRSGTAVQVDGSIRQSSLGARPYMNQIIKNFIQNLTKNLQIG